VCLLCEISEDYDTAIADIEASECTDETAITITAMYTMLIESLEKHMAISEVLKSKPDDDISVLH